MLWVKASDLGKSSPALHCQLSTDVGQKVSMFSLPPILQVGSVFPSRLVGLPEGETQKTPLQQKNDQKRRVWCVVRVFFLFFVWFSTKRISACLFPTILTSTCGELLYVESSGHICFWMFGSESPPFELRSFRNVSAKTIHGFWLCEKTQIKITTQKITFDEMFVFYFYFVCFSCDVLICVYVWCAFSLPLHHVFMCVHACLVSGGAYGSWSVEGARFLPSTEARIDVLTDWAFFSWFYGWWCMVRFAIGIVICSVNSD